MRVQLPPCAYFPLTAGVPCPNLKEEGGLPVAKTTADLYKLVCVGGIELCRERSCLSLRSHPYSCARPTHYNADKMPSQLKQKKPSGMSMSSLHIEKVKKNTVTLIFYSQTVIQNIQYFNYNSVKLIDQNMRCCVRKPCFCSKIGIAYASPQRCEIAPSIPAAFSLEVKSKYSAIHLCCSFSKEFMFYMGGLVSKVPMVVPDSNESIPTSGSLFMVTDSSSRGKLAERQTHTCMCTPFCETERDQR